ncbi:MAG: hypothetical protein OXC37_04725, partial [Bdellovibrionaceae bacterium]|nr:hypothetical protein [Pseudobdellovibrionaceae bacterium]
QAVNGVFKINNSSSQTSISKWEKDWCLQVDLKASAYNSAPSCISGKNGVIVHGGTCGSGCSFTAIASCTGGQEFNGVACACPNGNQWDAGTSSCVLIPQMVVCTGGQQRNTNTNTCECPATTPHFDITDTCISCTGQEPWNITTKTCQCPATTPNWDGTTCQAPCTGGKVWNNNQCECPADKPKWDGTNCKKCVEGAEWRGNDCWCIAPKTGWDGTKCVCPADKPNWDGTTCQAPCTAPKTKWDGTQCVCPDNTYGANCIACTGGKVWNNNQCECPADKPKWDGTQCKKCVEGAEWRGNDCWCIAPKTGWDGTKCVCPADKPNWDGTTCQAPCTAPKTKWDGTQCVCPDNTYGANCITCTGGKVWNVDKCECPADKPNWDGTNCQAPCTGGKVWNNNQCECPTDKPNWDGTNCVACTGEKTRWDSNTNQCECPTNKPNWNATANQCEGGSPCTAQVFKGQNGFKGHAYCHLRETNGGVTIRGRCSIFSHRIMSSHGPLLRLGMNRDCKYTCNNGNWTAVINNCQRVSKDGQKRERNERNNKRRCPIRIFNPGTKQACKVVRYQLGVGVGETWVEASPYHGRETGHCINSSSGGCSYRCSDGTWIKQANTCGK